ncbi:MAG: glutamate--tRNA ligase [Saprospiraceae bacterium]
MSKKVRVRFAPSPTGALHIGGIRTALYNYLYAKKSGGTFILRIEDTDQNRYVPGAEEYIVEALKWTGLIPEEGPGFGGDKGPYRQSERKDLYGEYAMKLLDEGHAYYAFDTADDLTAAREKDPNFKYDSKKRGEMKNSLTMPALEVAKKLNAGEAYVIRLKVPENETVVIQDKIRGEVKFDTNELDDKVMLKSDGMPTYHLANVVDDRLMEISDVIRGEEWLPSTAHHVLLYRFLGWENEMPSFSHLPLILKPDGNGKLSKRDGTRLGIPVFPLSWKGETPEDSFTGFREEGFLPDALVNFMAFMGWNPGTEEEMFSLEALCDAFSLDHVSKSGARFDIDKAKWYNQQYIIHKDNKELIGYVKDQLAANGVSASDEYIHEFVGLMKERVVVLPEFWEKGDYFFRDIQEYDDKMIRKKWKPESEDKFRELVAALKNANPFNSEVAHLVVNGFMEKTGSKAGEVMPVLRLTLSGTMQGPDVFRMMELLGKDKVVERLENGFGLFNEVCNRPVE